jgi:hypothetical protein
MRLWDTTMLSADYRHLREVFTEMALHQSNSPDVRQRWLAIAQTCFDLERNRPPVSSAQENALGVGAVRLPHWVGAGGRYI